MTQATEQHRLRREDLLWSGLSFPVLSEEELARMQGAVEDRVHFHRGVWWRRAKPFFWTPCFPHSRVDHRESWPHPLRALGGFTHFAAPDSPSNGALPTIVLDELSNYSIARLSHRRRNTIRRALGELTVRLIERLSELLTDGYEVYVSCHQRVHWGRNKCDRVVYERWITRAFQQSKQFVLAAYRGDKLVGFMLPFAVNNVVDLGYLASHSDFLNHSPNDLLFHAFFCIARQTPGIEMADLGPVCRKESLNLFKLHYGTIKHFPSYTWVNPFLRPMFNKWVRPRYPWLCGDPTETSLNSDNK